MPLHGKDGFEETECEIEDSGSVCAGGVGGAVGMLSDGSTGTGDTSGAWRRGFAVRPRLRGNPDWRWGGGREEAVTLIRGDIRLSMTKGENLQCPVCKATLSRSVDGLVESYRCLTDGCRWGSLYRIEGTNVLEHIEAFSRPNEWQPIETAPRRDRIPIELWRDGMEIPQKAFADTWWVGGFSAGIKPTHWRFDLTVVITE